jgi:hypothetical protein
MVFEATKWMRRCGGGGNGLTWKSFENVFSSQNIEFPFFKRERLLELFFLSLFLFLFLCSVSLLKKNSGIFEMFEEKIISSFLSNGMEVTKPRFMKLGELRKIYRRWMHTPEWAYASH